jgi:hypothetical protein
MSPARGMTQCRGAAYTNKRTKIAAVAASNLAWFGILLWLKHRRFDKLHFQWASFRGTKRPEMWQIRVHYNRWVLEQSNHPHSNRACPSDIKPRAGRLSSTRSSCLRAHRGRRCRRVTASNSAKSGVARQCRSQTRCIRTR